MYITIINCRSPKSVWPSFFSAFRFVLSASHHNQSKRSLRRFAECKRRTNVLQWQMVWHCQFWQNRTEEEKRREMNRDKSEIEEKCNRRDDCGAKKVLIADSEIDGNRCSSIVCRSLRKGLMRINAVSPGINSTMLLAMPIAEECVAQSE